MDGVNMGYIYRDRNGVSVGMVWVNIRSIRSGLFGSERGVNMGRVWGEYGLCGVSVGCMG